MVINRIGIIVDIRGDLGVLDADLINGFDQLIAAAAQALQIMADLVFSVRSNELVFNGIGVFRRAFSLGELVLGYCNGRLARVINRIVGDFIRNCRPRRSHSVREIAFDQIVDLGPDIDAIPIIIFIEVVDSELVGFNLVEHGNGIEAFRNRGTDNNRGVISFMLPVIEDLTFNKGIVRQGGDLITDIQINEILGFLCDDIAFIVFDKETYRDLIRKIGIKGQIGSDRGRCGILSSLSSRLSKPSEEGVTVFNGIRGQNDGGAGSGSHFADLRTVHQEFHRKDVLFIVGIDRQIL